LRARIAILIFSALGAVSGFPQKPPEAERQASLSESSDEISNLVGELDETRQSSADFDPLRLILDPWNDGWRWVNKERGLNMGFSYTALYQAVSKGSYDGPSTGAAGDLDVFGTWYLLNPGRAKGFFNEGTLGFNFEYRHAMDGLPPSELADSIGSLWGTTSGFDVQDPSLVQIWWQQKLLDDHIGFRFGKLDMASIFDVYRFNSSNHYYQNAAFSDNPAIPFPGNGLGFAVAWEPTDEWFLRYGFGDAEGSKTETINTGLVEAWFSAATVGWNSEVGSLGKGLYQITGWHSDRRSGSEKPNASGFSVLAQQELPNRWVPYARWAWSSQAAVDVQSLITTGAVLEGIGQRENDRVGFAVGWGQPHADGDRAQWTGELFYRRELIPEFRITPHVQVIVNPSRNRSDDVIGILGIRGRFTF
jgi:porin